MNCILVFLFTGFIGANENPDPSLESLGLPTEKIEPFEPANEEVEIHQPDELSPSPAVVEPRKRTVVVEQKRRVAPPMSAKATKRTNVKYETNTVVNVILSKANIKYALKKKKFGKLTALKKGGLLVQRVDSESLVENFALQKNDLILQCNSTDLVGGKSLGLIVKSARDMAKFTLTVRRGKDLILYKYQQ